MSREGQEAVRTWHADDKNLDHATQRRNARRAREFYRYLHPDHILTSKHDAPTYHLDKVPNLSQAFLPHCQLTTWRCKARKAMVNFMDRDVMYFVSESSVQKTMVNGEEHVDFVEDPILASCTSAPLEGKICERVLHTEPDETNRPPFFVISNLAESPFSHMPIIAGPPHYRFYAGTPIRTREGVNIGSLAIMDNQPRKCLTQDQEDFMANTANLIMSHLESHRQAIEGSRALRMTDALQSFFTGQTLSSSPDLFPNVPVLNASYCISPLRPAPQDRSDGQVSGRKAQHTSAPKFSPPFHLGNNIPSTTRAPTSASTGRSLILQRAATLIRECLDSASNITVSFFALSKNPLNTPDSKPLKQPHAGEVRRAQHLFKRPARVAARTNPNSADSATRDDVHSTNIDEEFLRLLAAKYPEGRLWDLYDDESDTSNEDSVDSLDGSNYSKENFRPRRIVKDTELQSLRAAFPSARQLMFAPVWDADSALASYCLFVESNSDVAPFSASTDLSFLRTFCSSITTEISKMEALLISKQKSDFVGTISHELRSPLHGILGSAEFLVDTELTNFQRSLVKTIETCGNTLLDTISHVLDYSKINSFEKQRPTNQSGLPTPEQGESGGMGVFDDTTISGASPFSQAAINTDMAATLEEVVDSLVRGRTYTHNVDLTDEPRKPNGLPSRSLDDQRTNQQTTAYPEVIMDIEPITWLFLTHPGAVKRIFMNVAGNALKFTSHGTVRISLTLKPSSDEDQTRTMLFEVIDTGPGISPEFMDSKLFLPFSQENLLSPGTGLGLSIAYNIVKMLGGWIDVKSDVGQGTTVRVELPLKLPSTRPMPRPRVGRTASIDSIVAIRNISSTTKIALYPSTRHNAARNIMAKYVTHWCQLCTCEDLESATIVILDENDLEDFVGTLDRVKPQPKVIVMCNETDTHRILKNQNALESILSAFECITKPCGPRKLARALRLILEKSTTDNAPAEHGRDNQVSDWLKDSSFESSDFRSDRNLASLNVNGLDTARATKKTSAGDPSSTRILDEPQMTLTPVSDRPSPRLGNSTLYAGNTSTRFNSAEKENVPVAPLPRARSPSPPRTPKAESQRQQTSIKPSHPVPSNTINRQNTLSNDTMSPQGTHPPRQPRVLLVDDNKVNLRLLETYLRKKRQYTDLTKAEDGQQAVDAFVTSSSSALLSSSMGSTIGQENFDLIFMDISMPIMDGFTATRAIRQYEAVSTPRGQSSNDVQIGPDSQKRTGAFIIAMTGLASAKDQTEGYESGCDVYMTKPVSFKEVSKLLDQWEANQQAMQAVTRNGSVLPTSITT